MADTWSYSAGEYEYTIGVYDRKPCGNIYIATQDPEGDGEIRRSLGHKDRDEVRKTTDRRLKISERGGTRTTDRPTVRQIFRLYDVQGPEKSERVQQADERHLEMWKLPRFRL